MVSNWKTQLAAKDGKLYLVTFCFLCGLSSLLWYISSHYGQRTRKSSLKFHIPSPNWSLCTNCMLWFDIVSCTQWICWRIGSVQYQTVPCSPQSSEPLSFILSADNTLLISSCKLSKTMKTSHIPSASWSIILLVQKVFPSARNGVYLVLISDFSSYFPFPRRFLQSLFDFRKEKKNGDYQQGQGSHVHY